MSCNDIFDDNQTLFDNSSSATIEPEDEITDVFDGFDFDTRSELSSISDDSEAKPEASEPILNRERNKKSVVGGHIKIDESKFSYYVIIYPERVFIFMSITSTKKYKIIQHGTMYSKINDN